MDALAARAQEGSLDMDAQEARHALGHGLTGGGDARFDGGQVVADQGGQKARGPEPAVRRANACDGLYRGVVVEQHPPTAVDLDVDEAGQQQAAPEVALAGGRRQLRGRANRHDAVAAQADGEALLETPIGHHPAIDQNDVHHTVSVTLLRWGGWSGSRPRARASPSAKR